MGLWVCGFVGLWVCECLVVLCSCVVVCDCVVVYMWVRFSGFQEFMVSGFMA